MNQTTTEEEQEACKFSFSLFYNKNIEEDHEQGQEQWKKKENCKI